MTSISGGKPWAMTMTTTVDLSEVNKGFNKKIDDMEPYGMYKKLLYIQTKIISNRNFFSIFVCGV